MGLFTLLARCFFSPRKKPSFADRLTAAPLAPRRLERRRVLDAAAASAVLAPLGDSSEFVQVGEGPDSPPPPAPVSANGEAENTSPDNLQIVQLDDLYENDIAELRFSFDDPDFEDTHEVEIDWGDGTAPEIINLDGGERFVQTTHQYLDDNPTKMPMDVNQVQITVTDSDDNKVEDSAPIKVSNVAPEITFLDVTSPIDENDVAELQLAFTDPGSLDTHTVEIDWGDGTAPEIINLNGGERFLQTTHQYLDDDPTKMPSDINQVKVTVTDDDMGSDMKTFDVDVNNVAPEITFLDVTSPIDENDVAELQLAFTDPGSLDTHTVEIDWGDGTAPEIINLNGGERFLQTTHQYLDDDPTKMPSDINQVKVTVTDDDMGSGMDMTPVTVNNVAPTVTLNPVMMIDENDFAELQITFTDPGSLDTHTVEIDWDDGTPTEIINLNGGERFVQTTHQYLDDDPTGMPSGDYQVKVTVTDDDMGSGMDMTPVTVKNVNPEITFLDVTPSIIDENNLVELQFSFTDIGTLDTHTAEIDWDDGTPIETINLAEGVQFVQTSHQYLDNDVDNIYTITVTVIDDDTGPGVETVPVTVFNVNPSLEPLIATDVNNQGETTLTLTFDDPGIEAAFLETGEVPFKVLVDWGDKLGEPDLEARFVVAEVHAGPTPKTFIIVHKFDGPPDPLHPAADIVIRVKIHDDDFGNPLVSEIGESNLEIVVISNPGIGGQPFRVDTTPQVPQLQFRREVRGDLLTEVTNTAEVSQQGSELRAVSTDAKATTESILELRVIDSYGIESEGVRLKSEVLNDLPKLFLTLPDNHYAIYLVRIETNTERLVIEVYVRNGKVIDPSDDSEGTRDRPPTDEAARERVQEILENDEAKPVRSGENSADTEEVRRALEAELEPGDEILIEPVAEPEDQGAMLHPGGLLPIAAGLVATRSFGTWAQQVNRAVAQAGPKKWRELRRRSRKNRKNR